MPIYTISRERERPISDLNKSLLPIVEDDINFSEVAPLLFSMEFAKKQEMVDQVKAMQCTIFKQPERKSKCFFQGAPPPRRSKGGTEGTEGAEPKPTT